MNISIICPLYNAEKYIVNLDNSIKIQKAVELISIKYILTESNDNTESILKQLNASYKKVPREKFSHSIVREQAAFEAEGDIIVFITQDVIIKDDMWLHKLVSPIICGEVDAAFSRQICDNNSIEKYIREKNYPKESRVMTSADIERLGLITFFFSDVSSAIRRDVFIKMSGYDGKNLITNEDMYISYKMITNGYNVKYCSDSVVVHSHDFTLMQLLRRYFDTGVFLKQNSYLLNFKVNKGGMDLLKYSLKHALKEKNIKVLINLIPNFAARFIGSALGKRYDKLSKRLRIYLSSNKSYWLSQE